MSIIRIINQTRREQRFAITSATVQADTVLPARTVATYTWPAGHAQPADRAQPTAGVQAG